MLTSVAATAANTAGHTAINKAKSSATNAAKSQLKKSFFRQRTAEEVVKKGQSGRAAEAIVGYKQSKILKIYGKHVDDLICEYCEIFYSYYEGDDAPAPQLRLFEVQRDLTQCLPLQYVWPKTQKVTNARPLNNLTDILRSPTDAAVYDFFKSMQAQDPEFTKETGRTSNPITVACYIIPVVVDRISSISDSKLLTELYTALSTFCKKLYVIGEKYYGTYWTRNPYIVEFLKCNRKLIRSFSTESIKNYKVPTIDEFVPDLFTDAGIIAVEMQNIVRNFLPGHIIRSDINTPRCVGVRFDMLHARGGAVNEDLLIQEADSLPDITAEQDGRITSNTEEFIKFATRADTNAEKFIKYVFELASDKPDQEREKNKSRLLDSIIRRLDQQEEFITTDPESHPKLFEEKAIIQELKQSSRFKSLAKKEKERIIKSVKFNTIPNMSKLFIKSAQFYRECVAMESAMRALKFYVEDSKSAVFTPNVKDFIEYLNSLFSRINTFTQELIWFSADEYFCYTEKDLMGENIEEYSGFISNIIDTARDCRNKISEAITLANSNTSESAIRKTRKNNLTSDRLKVFDISLHILLCFNPSYPSYQIEHLGDIREKIWGKYAWSKVQSDCESETGNDEKQTDLHTICKRLRQYTENHSSPRRRRHTRHKSRPLRRNTTMINLQDGRETERIKQKVEKAADAYDKYSLENRHGFGMYVTGKHSDKQIQQAKHEAQIVAGLCTDIQDEITANQSDAMNIIKKLYQALTLIIDKSSDETKHFGSFVSDELLDIKNDKSNAPFIKYYYDQQKKKSIKSGNKQTPRSRLRSQTTDIISEDEMINTQSESERSLTPKFKKEKRKKSNRRMSYTSDESSDHDDWSNEETSYSDADSIESASDISPLETKRAQPDNRRQQPNHTNRRSKYKKKTRSSITNKNQDNIPSDLESKKDSSAMDSTSESESEKRLHHQEHRKKKVKQKKKTMFSMSKIAIFGASKEEPQNQLAVIKRRPSSFNDASGDEAHHYRRTVRKRRSSKLTYDQGRR